MYNIDDTKKKPLFWPRTGTGIRDAFCLFLARFVIFRLVDSQARVNGFLNVTRLALDLAAPVESACAPFDHDHFLRPIASAAAHQVAAVDADRGVVALAAVRALDAQPRVLQTEAGRRFKVDEVLATGRLVLRIVRLQLELVSGVDEREIHS